MSIATQLEDLLGQRQPRTLALGGSGTAGNGDGLVKLVLALVKVIHELLEKQAIRRMDEGSLSDEALERLGSTLCQQAQQLQAVCAQFGLTMADLEIDLGPWLKT